MAVVAGIPIDVVSLIIGGVIGYIIGHILGKQSAYSMGMMT